MYFYKWFTFITWKVEKRPKRGSIFIFENRCNKTDEKDVILPGKKDKRQPFGDPGKKTLRPHESTSNYKQEERGPQVCFIAQCKGQMNPKCAG